MAVRGAEMSESYVFVLGRCVCCPRMFSFNPHKVPSSRALSGNTREPICRECFEEINKLREAKGWERMELQPGAYEPIPESDL